MLLGYGRAASSHVACATNTRGVFAGRWDDALTGPWLRTDALMLSGHSGGPLVSQEGRVVGWSVRSHYDRVMHGGGGYYAAGLNEARPVSALRNELALALREQDADEEGDDEAEAEGGAEEAAAKGAAAKGAASPRASADLRSEVEGGDESEGGCSGGGDGGKGGGEGASKGSGAGNGGGGSSTDSGEGGKGDKGVVLEVEPLPRRGRPSAATRRMVRPALSQRPAPGQRPMPGRAMAFYRV